MGRVLKKIVRLRSGLRLDPGNILLLIYLSILMLFLILGAVVKSAAFASQTEQTIETYEPKGGELLAIQGNGELIPAPLLSQKVAMQVSGIVNRVKVIQRFVNSTESWIEAVYVFPLPDESGVDHMRLRVGERVIEGEIMEKTLAQKTHEKAKREGRKSSLVKQNRPNMFTTKVANIGPGEEVSVEIEYQQIIDYRDNRFSLRFPMVVAPRYIPGKPLQERIQLESSGWALDTDQVPDASEITPPVDLQDSTAIPVELSVDLVSGIPLARVDSLYHKIVSKKIESGHYKIDLTDEVYADRDFVLEWEPEDSKQVQAALFSESVGSDQYLLLMLLPPQKEMDDAPIPREVIYILDVSGSMAGASIAQAKSSLSFALESLGDLDTFNLITFNNSVYSLFGRPKPATQKNLQKAQDYITSIKADGGTEMLPALKMALDGVPNHERLRQVIFLTDGAVGNESKLLAMIAERLGDSRLFTVGIGSAPNGYFMTRVARMGRGTFLYIGKQTEVRSKIEQLVKKLQAPAVTDISLNLNGENYEIEVYPSPFPDLYHGEPLILAMKSGWYNSALRISGSGATNPWQTIVDTSTFGNRKGIGALWARKKIRNQMESLSFGADEKEVRETITKTALEHHLVSRYTSLVGVDKQVSRPASEKIKKAPVKTHLPKGWQASAVFGGGAQTASPAAFRLVIGLSLLFLGLVIYLGWKRYEWNR